MNYHSYKEAHELSIKNPEEFWAKEAENYIGIQDGIKFLMIQITHFLDGLLEEKQISVIMR